VSRVRPSSKAAINILPLTFVAASDNGRLDALPKLKAAGARVVGSSAAAEHVEVAAGTPSRE
jgi:hypothetical protein